MSDTSEKIEMGWLPDYPDFRDFTVDHDEILPKMKELRQKESIKTMLTKAGVGKSSKKSASFRGLKGLVLSDRESGLPWFLHGERRSWGGGVF